MRKIATLFLLAVSSCSLAQPSLESVEAEIRKLEEKERKAMLNRDVSSLQEIWATDFMVNAPLNRVTMGAQEVIDLVKAGKIRYVSFTRSIEEVMIKDGVAITMGSEVVVPEGDVPDAGKTVKRRYTNIWMNDNGRWKLTARHANKIAE